MQISVSGPDGSHSPTVRERHALVLLSKSKEEIGMLGATRKKIRVK